MSTWADSLDTVHQQRQAIIDRAKSRSYIDAVEGENDQRKALTNVTNEAKKGDEKSKEKRAGVKRWLSFSRKHKEDAENARPTPSGRRSLLKRSKSIGSGDSRTSAPVAEENIQKKEAGPNLFGMDVSGMQKDQIDMLRKFVISLGEENHRLKTEKPQLIHENNELMTANEALRHKLKVAETQISVFDDRIHELRSKNHQLEQEVEILKDELNAPAFV
eukprot:m.76900 g.76900  ORF g.76900 m.76900 type:complete len:218 (-) comp24949_c0_seq1:120-773(-)